MPAQLTHSENKPTFTPAAEQKRVCSRDPDSVVKEEPLTEGILQRQSQATIPGNIPPPIDGGHNDFSRKFQS